MTDTTNINSVKYNTIMGDRHLDGPLDLVFECVLSILILVFFSTALANFLKTDPNLTFLAENVILINIIGLLLLIAYLTIYLICYYNYEEEIRAWQKKRKRRR